MTVPTRHACLRFFKLCREWSRLGFRDVPFFTLLISPAEPSARQQKGAVLGQQGGTTANTETMSLFSHPHSGAEIQHGYFRIQNCLVPFVVGKPCAMASALTRADGCAR